MSRAAGALPLAHRPGDRTRTARLAVLGAAVLLVVAILVSLAVGPTGVGLTALQRVVMAALGAAADGDLAREKLILVDIRLPRTVVGLLVGAALAVAGAVLQGLFRNPLADPSLLGASPGAALFAAAMIAFQGPWLAPVAIVLGTSAVAVAAFAGALAATMTLYVLATRGGRTAVATLLLAGVALGAFAQALTGWILFTADDRALRDITFWTLGSLGGASWSKVLAALPLFLVAAIGVPLLARALNAFLLGEAEAAHLGVSTERAKRIAVVATAAGVGAAVSIAGVIGFVGIIVPHLVRLFTGPDHRFVLPASALGGGALVLLADALARAAAAPAEMPIGVVTAAIGAPVFLWLLLRKRPVG